MIRSRPLSTLGFLSYVTPTELQASPPLMILGISISSEGHCADDHRCSLLTYSLDSQDVPIPAPVRMKSQIEGKAL